MWSPAKNTLSARCCSKMWTRLCRFAGLAGACACTPRGRGVGLVLPVQKQAQHAADRCGSCCSCGAPGSAALQASHNFCAPQGVGDASCVEGRSVACSMGEHASQLLTLMPPAGPSAERWSHLSEQVIAPVQPLVDGSCPDQRVPIEGSRRVQLGTACRAMSGGTEHRSFRSHTSSSRFLLARLPT